MPSAVTKICAAILIGVAALSFAALPTAEAAKKDKTEEGGKRKAAKKDKGGKDAQDGNEAQADPADDREAAEAEVLKGGGKIRIDRDTGLVLGAAEKGASIGETIERLGKLAGVEVEVRGNPGNFEDEVSLEGLRLDDAMTKAAGANSLLLTYAADAAKIASVVLIGNEGGAGGQARRVQVDRDDKARDRRDEDERPDEAVARGNAVAAQADPQTERAARQREIAGLAQSGDGSSVEELRETVAKSDDPDVRRSALSALAGLGGRENFSLFSTALRDRDGDVRVEAARSLMRLDGVRGKPLIEAAARREPVPSVRAALMSLAAGEAVEREGRMPGAPVQQ